MCRDVNAKTGASIEMSYAKDKSLNILATGKPNQVAMARREILKKLQTPVCVCMPSVEINIVEMDHCPVVEMVVLICTSLDKVIKT